MRNYKNNIFFYFAGFVFRYVNVVRRVHILIMLWPFVWAGAQNNTELQNANNIYNTDSLKKN